LPEWCRKCYDRYDFWGSVPYRRRIIKGLVDHVARFTSPSQRLIDIHAEAGYDPSRFRVLRTGIDLSLFQAPVSAGTRRIVQEFAPYNTVLFAGHIVRIKGLDVLAQALPIMQRYIPSFRVLVAGAGEPQLIEQLIQAAPGAVRHVGKLAFYELRPVYASATLTIVPSIWFDNSPTVIYESLLMGTPALGSRIGGIPELIEEGVTGYLFRAGDPAELAEKAIAHFARPAKERREMRRRCAEYAAKNLTLDVHIDRLIGIYGEAMETTAARAGSTSVGR
jgi:glycosyltransferase involved in cell wall biosynthesis